MALSRRHFLSSMGVGAAALALPRPAVSARSKPNRPTMFLHIVLRGGMDALLTTDPKTAKQVFPRIEIPYGEAEIETIGSTRIGPLFKPLKHVVPRMAIVNNMQCGTVSHFTGNRTLAQARRIFPENSTGIAGLVGGLVRGDGPCDQVIIAGTMASPQGQGRAIRNEDGLIEHLAAALREQNVRQVVHAELEHQLAATPDVDRRIALEVCDGLVRALTKYELPKPPSLDLPRPSFLEAVAKQEDARWAMSIRDILYLFQHRLTGGIFFEAPAASWDSHQDNDLKQAWCMDRFAPNFSYLLDALDKTSTDDGVPLAHQVAIVVSSELGRFPIKNELSGKDHFPEQPVVFIGPGIRPGQYGETDDHMMTQPISMQTGRASSSRTDVAPTIDDLGATLLRWFGVEDTVAYGYLGRPLEFLFA